MPGGDGTGPAGMGPMTGRAAGYCAGYSAPGSVNPDPGRGGGFGFGRGFGRGLGLGFRRGRGAPFFSRGYYPQPGVPAYGAAPRPEDEAQVLKDEAQYLEKSLDAVKKRIADLEAAAGGKPE